MKNKIKTKKLPSKLKVPIEILADLLKNSGADLRECYLPMLRFSKTSYQSKPNQIQNQTPLKP